MARDSDIEFRASDLIGPAGTGSNGERLVNSLLDHYPEQLQAALIRRINPVLDDELNDKALSSIAKIAGVDHIEQAHVRGGEGRLSDAVVTYAWLDEKGTVWKGCFPHANLQSGKSDGHVSQRDSLARSATAQQHLKEHPLPASAPADQQPVAPADPYDALESASAQELVEQMREHPERAEAIKAFERAVRGKSARKTVLEFEAEGESVAEGDGDDEGLEPQSPGPPQPPAPPLV